MESCFGPFGHFLAFFGATSVLSLLFGILLVLALGPFKEPPYSLYRSMDEEKVELAWYSYMLIYGIVSMIIVLVLGYINEQMLPPHCYLR